MAIGLFKIILNGDETMNIKTKVEITAELSKKDVKNIVKNYLEAQGYEVIRIDTETEIKYPKFDGDLRASSRSTVEFAGFKVYLKKKTDE